ncbi:MAG: hypothetical protein EB127_21780 [Alphaproteobacteria bacterium]|nr:hypothetical protein [Alphaproteobacteria bacterium]
MAEPTSAFNTPTLWINAYLQEQLATNPNLNVNLGLPFFPSSPTTIDELTEQWVVINDERYAYAGVMATWDRLVRMRRSPFPHIKQEQLLYYFYATAQGVTDQMVQIQEAVLRLMDREDETAQDINNWAKGKVIDGMTCKFQFHRFRIYQLEETRDIIDFGTARTYGGNKIIIDFEYHQMQDIINN